MEKKKASLLAVFSEKELYCNPPPFCGRLVLGPSNLFTAVAFNLTEDSEQGVGVCA